MSGGAISSANMSHFHLRAGVRRTNHRTARRIRLLALQASTWHALAVLKWFPNACHDMEILQNVNAVGHTCQSSRVTVVIRD